ncbi:MAG: galactokinase, partial [Hyphomonadaceae bacterium]|nr:galactokinase [Hyphomonadaceae bacterium]
MLVDSGVKHAHVEGEYARRRADCEMAAQTLGVNFLCDVKDMTALSVLSGNLAKRATHVVTEIARTHQARAAIARGDLMKLGQLMNESHASLSEDMEVSTPEVDVLAQIARQTAHVYGARMMGGGFGGSVIVLLDGEYAQHVQDQI